MPEPKQPYYDYLVIQSKKSLKVEKGVLRRQTKKRTTACFDQLCSKINQENKARQNSSTRKIAMNL